MPTSGFTGGFASGALLIFGVFCFLVMWAWAHWRSCGWNALAFYAAGSAAVVGIGLPYMAIQNATGNVIPDAVPEFIDLAFSIAMYIGVGIGLVQGVLKRLAGGTRL